jgi:hypothetical protein
LEGLKLARREIKQSGMAQNEMKEYRREKMQNE